MAMSKAPSSTDDGESLRRRSSSTAHSAGDAGADEPPARRTKAPRRQSLLRVTSTSAANAGGGGLYLPRISIRMDREAVATEDPDDGLEDMKEVRLSDASPPRRSLNIVIQRRPLMQDSVTTTTVSIDVRRLLKWLVACSMGTALLSAVRSNLHVTPSTEELRRQHGRELGGARRSDTPSPAEAGACAPWCGVWTCGLEVCKDCSVCTRGDDQQQWRGRGVHLLPGAPDNGHPLPESTAQQEGVTPDASGPYPMLSGPRDRAKHARDECCTTPERDTCRRCTPRELSSASLRASISWHRHLLLPEGWPNDAPPLESLGDRLPYSRTFVPTQRSASEALLDGTAMRRLAGKWMAAPHQRLMFCPMEKNGATEWIRLFGAINGKARAAANEGIAWSQMVHDSTEKQLPSLHAFDYEQRAAMFNAPSVVKFVVIRDPLERLLSAYLDKCAFQHTRGPPDDEELLLMSHCPGFYHSNHEQKTPREMRRGDVTPLVPTFDAFVGNLTRQRMRSDPHFGLQRDICGLSPTGAGGGPSVLPFVQYVLRLGPDFHASLDTLFAHVGINASLHRTFFPQASSALHRTSASKKLAKYYTPDIARLAYDLYSPDYEALRLPAPELEIGDAAPGRRAGRRGRHRTQNDDAAADAGAADAGAAALTQSAATEQVRPGKLLARCSSHGTVVGTIASASYAEKLRSLAGSAVGVGFGCVAVSAPDSWPDLLSNPKLQALPPPLAPLLPRPQWCNRSLVTRYGWRRAGLYKARLWRFVVADEGYDLFAVDCDWVLQASPFPLLTNMAGMDVVAMHDGPSGKLLNVRHRTRPLVDAAGPLREIHGSAARRWA